MPDPVFYDTLKAGTSSKRGKVYVQAYCTIYGWIHCHPIQNKSESRDMLNMMFKPDGVLTKMVVDNFKGKSLDKFARKCRESDCRLVSNETFLSGSELAEGFIRELKHVSS